jgi:hypothetical protein
MAGQHSVAMVARQTHHACLSTSDNAAICVLPKRE